MAMTLGEVNVSEVGVVTKSGIAGRYYDAIYASLTVSLPDDPTLAAPFLRQIAAQATAQATAMYNSITQDARAKIAKNETGSGLQRLPSSIAAGNETAPPADDKFLPIV